MISKVPMTEPDDFVAGTLLSYAPWPTCQVPSLVPVTRPVHWLLC